MKSIATITSLTLLILMSMSFLEANIAAAQDLEFVGQCNVPQYAVRLFVEGDYAYVTGLGSGLHIISIANPSAPELMGSCDTPGWALNVAVSGNYAYVADSASGVQIIDISDPGEPTLVGNIPSQAASYGVFTDNDYLYICDGAAGFCIYSIANPANPVFQGDCDVLEIAGGIYVKDGYAYIGDHGSGFAIISIDDPLNPSIVGYCGMQCDPYGINLNGNYAYVAVGEDGYRIIDVADPENPEVVGGMPAQWFTHNVFSENHFAFMADMSYGVKVYDIINPAAPVLLDSFITFGYAYGISARQNFVYVANDNYFTVLYFNPPPHQCNPEALYSQPATMPDGNWWGLPSDVNTSFAVFDNLIGFSGTVNKVRFWGGPMYFSDEWQRCEENPMDFKFVFFEDNEGFPGNEVCRRSATATGIPTGVFYPFEDLMLNTRQYEVVFDNSCEINGGWISIQGSSYGGDPQDCMLVWTNAMEGDGDNLCLFWNGSEYEWWSFDMSLCLEDEAVGISDNPNIDLPKNSSLKNNYPNPFNAQTMIEYELSSAVKVKIEIYDILGRKVETLLNEKRQAGHHQISWNAENLSSGVYFYRLQAGDYIEAMRMTLLK